ncbi:hypothetical protein Q5752_000276 [Cryptotrichosporon argae]
MPDSKTVSSAENAAHATSQVMQGRVPNASADEALGHPIHPATVHWPIAFLTTSFSALTVSALPSTVLGPLTPVASFPAIAHYTAAAGALTALPAIATGVGELYEMARAQRLAKGSWAAVVGDAWHLRDEAGQKLKTTMTHASANDAVVLLATVNWWIGRKSVGYALPRTNVVLSALALPALGYSAYLGGKLVYEYGVGVQRQGSGKEIKEKSS